MLQLCVRKQLDLLSTLCRLKNNAHGNVQLENIQSGANHEILDSEKY
jgi:hypothetical protein